MGVFFETLIGGKIKDIAYSKDKKVKTIIIDSGYGGLWGIDIDKDCKLAEEIRTSKPKELKG